MTSPVEPTRVKCPDCGLLYEDWYRASINLTLDDFDDEYIEESTTSTCPECGFNVQHSALVVRPNNVWEFHGDDDD